MARTGKIARLPMAVRDELNKRLQNGQLGDTLIPWLNSLPEVQTVLADFFAGQEINGDNLSAWFKGGYQEWLEKQDKTYRIKELAAYAAKLAAANGGTISDGAHAIASGKILELLEGADGSLDPEQLGEVINAVVKLKRSDQDDAVIRQNDKRLEQKDRDIALAENRFQRDTCELFIKYAQDQKAIEIATSPLSNDAKINEMGKVLFGDLWQKAKPAA